MTRGIWKGPFVHPSLLKQVDKLKDKGKKQPIKNNESSWLSQVTIL